MIAGGVESMSRAPFVMGKAEAAFQRSTEILRHDDRMAICESEDARDLYGTDSMPETGENVARECQCGAHRAGCVCVPKSDARGAGDEGWIL